MAKDFELLVLFTSSPGFHVDVKIAEMMKDSNPKMKVAFVGPAGDHRAGQSSELDQGDRFHRAPRVRLSDRQLRQRHAALEDLPGVSYRKNGENVHNPEGGYIENLDELPWVSKVYKRDLDFTRYNVPFLLHPYISFYTTRGCPAMCTFCLWPQTHSGHRWRLRSAQDIANECRYTLENFPGLKEIFFDDDTFNYRKARTLELCAELKKLNFTWSCTSRVTTDYETLKAMKEAGCRLLIVGYEIGRRADSQEHQEGRHHRHGAALHRQLPQAGPGDPRRFHRRPAGRDARHPAQYHRFRQAPGCARPFRYPSPTPIRAPSSTITPRRTTWCRSTWRTMKATSCPTSIYPGILDRAEMVDWVERFYGEYYFRPKAAWRIVRKAMFDNHERKRLYKEAKSYLALRHKRKKYVAEHRRPSALAQEPKSVRKLDEA